MDPVEIKQMAEIEESHWWFRERRVLIARELRTLSAGRALDIGAAAGRNTTVLEEHGWESFALEYDESGALLAKDRGIKVMRADATKLPLPDDHFDLAISFDVLEHIEDDATVAQEIKRVLKPGGSVLIAVPADPRLWSDHDVAVSHVRRYTRESLSKLFEEAGFTIEEVWSWNVLLRPAIAWKRKRPANAGSDIESVSPPLNRLLHGIVALERYLPVGRMPGVSLMLRAHVG
ncbi:bifunctional 2-polyprenyl-6-hydroxyphenol methylase/3-demethylubiquinol 3-O-methyltransferase UbiG [Aeromicrobium sp.]|uniref:class I SAM-dependent methyltransferase n=1 Tax=Aeromicrobium sp. TaxID=1871063 RepID=UPI0019A5F948|nr:class I SAM-dependent methyltransferase [Aeromicrobium sp.]MBC7630840.1 class I SAM-dependent methyltransferase [Aeromicrobium sp.]